MTFDDDLRLLAAVLPDRIKRNKSALSEILERYADMRPDYMLAPVSNAEAAALLGKTPDALRVMRSRGMGPPGFTEVPGLGSVYPSRAHILEWAAEQFDNTPEKRNDDMTATTERIIQTALSHAAWKAYDAYVDERDKAIQSLEFWTEMVRANEIGFVEFDDSYLEFVNALLSETERVVALMGPGKVEMPSMPRPEPEPQAPTTDTPTRRPRR